MIITKHYEIGITGKFQSRRFGTTLTVDTSEVKETELSKVPENLQRMCADMVSEDIKTMRKTDPNFVIIEAAAQDELDKFVKYKEGVKKIQNKKD